ncbi:MAG: RsmB/NOP family class I SAM-dependent RNA methyltransferase [Clostridiaceae bacterium]|nr:RsmB/NOP family class I SAM-dependent RNA methyltransferase [Clostridiaceae bacterium]
MIRLPEEYCGNMKRLLGEQYQDYLDSFSKKPHTAFRINTRKISEEEWKQKNPFQTEPVPWTAKGYYYREEQSQPSKHPYYYAGLYYIQEPSAMIPADILPVFPGERVLDLCAAPGGKATELGAKLQGQGLLVANDISVSRSMALVKNLQLAGIFNSVVTAEAPEKLAGVFPGFFDKILVDAPCSGEGMFRREPRMVQSWLQKGPSYYAEVQKKILSEAYDMLKPGGSMVYSTCTFSLEEDEAVVQWFLEEYSDMMVCPVEQKEGFSGGRPDLLEEGKPQLRHCVRIYPHRARGEGHFAVLLKKADAACRQGSGMEAACSGDSPEGKNGFGWERMPEKQISDFCGHSIQKQSGRQKAGGQKKHSPPVFDNAWKELKSGLLKLPLPEGNLSLYKDQVFWQPVPMENLRGIRVVANGIALCRIKQKIHWSQSLALAFDDALSNRIDFLAEDENVMRYLKGETLQLDSDGAGYFLVTVDGYGLGWCQGNGTGSFKNKYYPGWRCQS